MASINFNSLINKIRDYTKNNNIKTANDLQTYIATLTEVGTDEDISIKEAFEDIDFTKLFDSLDTNDDQSIDSKDDMANAFKKYNTNSSDDTILDETEFAKFQNAFKLTPTDAPENTKGGGGGKKAEEEVNANNTGGTGGTGDTGSTGGTTYATSSNAPEPQDKINEMNGNIEKIQNAENTTTQALTDAVNAAAVNGEITKEQQAQYQNNQNAIDTCEGNITTHQTEIETQDGIIAQANIDIANAQNAIVDAQDRIGSLNSKISEARAQNAKAEEEEGEQTGTVNRKKPKKIDISGLLAELARAQDALTEAQKAETEAKNRLTEAQEAKDVAQLAKETEETRLNTQLLPTKDKLIADIAASLKEGSALKGAIQTYQKEIPKIRQDNNTANTNLKKYEEELEEKQQTDDSKAKEPITDAEAEEYAKKIYANGGMTAAELQKLIDNGELNEADYDKILEKMKTVAETALANNDTSGVNGGKPEPPKDDEQATTPEAPKEKDPNKVYITDEEKSNFTDELYKALNPGNATVNITLVLKNFAEENNLTPAEMVQIGNEYMKKYRQNFQGDYIDPTFLQNNPFP